MQVTINVLVRTMEHAMEWYLANPKGWGYVIELLLMLVTKGDLERLVRLQSQLWAFWMYPRLPHLQEMEINVCWRKQIRYDLLWSTWAEQLWEGWGGQPLWEEDNFGGEYFLALHQWNAYKAWLTIHPEEKRFLWFEVFYHLFKYCFVAFLRSNDSFVAKGALSSTLLKQRDAGGLLRASYAPMVGSADGKWNRGSGAGGGSGARGGSRTGGQSNGDWRRYWKLGNDDNWSRGSRAWGGSWARVGEL